MTKDRREYLKAWKAAHRESEKAKMKAWYEENKERIKEYKKAYNQVHKEEIKAYSKAYKKSDINVNGQTKHSIRLKSRRYLSKYGKKIDDYQIHHCCTYTEPYKFIYCSKEMHKLIHSYLRQHNISADSDHYEYIKHLLDDSVVKYGLE